MTADSDHGGRGRPAAALVLLAGLAAALTGCMVTESAAPRPSPAQTASGVRPPAPSPMLGVGF
jgi:hypothetical protein